VPTATKRSSRKAAPQRTKTSDQASSPLSNASLRFYYAETLRAKTLAVLTKVEKAKDRGQYRNDLADTVMELTDSGMDYYFLKPLRTAEVSFLGRQSANLGIGATTRIMSPVIRKVIGGMDNCQLLVVCAHIRQLMR